MKAPILLRTTVAFLLLSVLTVSLSSPAIARHIDSIYGPTSPTEHDISRLVLKRNLTYGCTGNDVAALQEVLFELGYIDDEPDGSFGPVTRKAVMLFQLDNGIKASGTVTIEDAALFEDSMPITSEEKAQLEEKLEAIVTERNTPAVSYSYGPAGRLFIPGADISVALYPGSFGGYGAQTICDWQDAAVIMYGNVIADHNHQGFSTLAANVVPGMQAYIEYAGGGRIYYTCVSIDRGVNDGYVLWGSGGDSMYDWGYSLTMYTCLTNWNDVFICHWNRVG